MQETETWKSKKLWFAVGCIAMAFLFAVLSATVIPALEPMFEQFCGILEFIGAAYLTGNIANKFVTGKLTQEADPKPAKVATKKQALEAEVAPGGPKVPDDED